MDPINRLLIESECRQLCVRFARHLDNGDYEAMFALFTPDGVFDRAGQILCGHEQMRAAFGSRPPGIRSRHVVTNIDFLEVSARDAEARIYNLSFHAVGDEGAGPLTYADGERQVHRLSRPLPADRPGMAVRLPDGRRGVPFPGIGRSSRMRRLEIPVLIVGGGCTGLSASIFLSDLGVQSLLVERHAGTSILPKAHYLNQRTMEIFALHGAAEAIYTASAPRHTHGKITWMTSLGGDGPFDRRTIGEIDIMGGGGLRETYDSKGMTHPTHIPQLRLEPVRARSPTVAGRTCYSGTSSNRSSRTSPGCWRWCVTSRPMSLVEVHAQYLLAGRRRPVGRACRRDRHAGHDGYGRLDDGVVQRRPQFLHHRRPSRDAHVRASGTNPGRPLRRRTGQPWALIDGTVTATSGLRTG